MWLFSPVIAETVRLKIIDTPFMLTILQYFHLLDVQQLYAMMHTVIIDCQYVSSMYKDCYPNGLKTVDIWATNVRIIRVIHNIRQWSSSAFGLQLTACWSVH